MSHLQSNWLFCRLLLTFVSQSRFLLNCLGSAMDSVSIYLLNFPFRIYVQVALSLLPSIYLLNCLYNYSSAHFHLLILTFPGVLATLLFVLMQYLFVVNKLFPYSTVFLIGALCFAQSMSFSMVTCPFLSLLLIEIVSLTLSSVF